MDPIVSLRVTKTVVGLIGICGNGLVCIVICLVKPMHTTTNLFIFNQATIDFFGCLMLILSSNIPVPVPLPFGVAGALLCHMWISDSIIWLLYSASTYNLVMLTFERYFAIVYPFKYRLIFAYRKSIPVIMIVFTWLMGLLVTIYGSAIFAPVDGHCVPVNITGGNVLGILIICLYYVFPIVFLIFAYIHISVELKRSLNRTVPVAVFHVSTRPDQQHDQVPRQPEDPIRRARLNVFKTLVTVVGAYIICWTPNEIIFFLFNLGWQLDFSSPLYIVSVALVAVNSCINPLIYAMKYKQFKQAIVGLFFRQGSNNAVESMELHTHPGRVNLP